MPPDQVPKELHRKICRDRHERGCDGHAMRFDDPFAAATSCELLLRANRTPDRTWLSWNRLTAFMQNLVSSPGPWRSGPPRAARAAGRRFLAPASSRSSSSSPSPCPRPARADSRPAAAFISRRDRHRLRHLELRVLAHVADHVHADPLIQNLLQLVGQRKILDDERSRAPARVRRTPASTKVADPLAQFLLVRRHVEERHLAFARTCRSCAPTIVFRSWPSRSATRYNSRVPLTFM